MLCANSGLIVGMDSGLRASRGPGMTMQVQFYEAKVS
jgi:hypothetical protein